MIRNVTLSLPVSLVAGIRERARQDRCAQHRLGHGGDPDAAGPQTVHQLRGVVRDEVRTDLQPRRRHTAAASRPSSAGKAARTMSTSSDGGRNWKDCSRAPAWR